MSNQIPGVPEGWELVEFRKPNQGEWVINWAGQIEQWSHGDSAYVFAIIRKIEKPATYRHFANAEEYLPHWGKPIRLKGGAGFDSVVSTSDLGVYVASGTKTVWYSMGEAFAKLTFADGTPFGVQIDE
jgi:hypothetical protein